MAAPKDEVCAIVHIWAYVKTTSKKKRILLRQIAQRLGQPRDVPHAPIVMNSPGGRDLAGTLDFYSASLPEVHSETQCATALMAARQDFKQANDALGRLCRTLQLDGRYDPTKLTLALCRFRGTRRAVWLLEGAITALSTHCSEPPFISSVAR